jgi:RNAse (barnase) inhibitor barstar
MLCSFIIVTWVNNLGSVWDCLEIQPLLPIIFTQASLTEMEQTLQHQQQQAPQQPRTVSVTL